MKPLLSALRNERGVALPLALFALVMLSGLLLAFLTMSGMEPTIAANLNDVARARYLADTGIELAYDLLAVAPSAGPGSWDALLGGTQVVGSNPRVAWVTPAPPLPPATLPGLPNFGTYTLQIRNDVLAADQALTGLPPEPAANTTTDANGAVILTASGTSNGVTRTVQVVVRRVTLPPFAGAFNMSGIQADLWFNNTNFNIDGRDYTYTCTANCSDPNPLNRTYSYSLNSDQSKMKYGIATSLGNQPNLPGFTFEQRAEYKLDTPPKQANVMGKDQVGGGFTTGLGTVAGDGALGPFVAVPDGTADTPQSPQKLNTFLSQLAQFQATTVLQSSLSCAQNVAGIPVGIRMIGNPDPTKANLVTLQGCVNQTLDLGTVDNPKLVYFKGDLDPTSSFAGVRTEGAKIKGAGILIVEDGDLRMTADLDWDGLVIVTGRYVTITFEGGAKTNIYGATASNETKSQEGGATETDATTLWDGFFNSANITTLRYSQQNLNLMQKKLLFRMSTWREL